MMSLRISQESANLVDKIACLLLHEKFTQTRDGNFLRFIIIIALPPAPTRVCECLPARRVLLFTSAVEWKKKIFFFCFPTQRPSFRCADQLIPLAISELSRVNVV